MFHPAESNHTLIERAVQLLRAGELVAFPTETVYGLGADATNPVAVAKIFALKGRPATNPVIVHVADIAAARRYAAEWPEVADRLAAAFWPGPLTLVVRRAANIADTVAAGGGTVGLRIPAHPVALELLRAFDGAVAAPSANRSNHVSPTTAAHVRDEFGDAVAILNGGPCTVGIESTVLDLTGPRPMILRPGGVSAIQIATELNMAIDEGTSHPVARSPGQLLVHYAPRTPAFRFEPNQRLQLDLEDAAIIELTLDSQTYARNLYARLRLLDTQSLRAIYVELPPDLPDWQAARDRVMRATKPYVA